ncbi:hypothetical protein FRB94_001777 [Tulasnella sp. JGI-2019a]|nr:hypothetical protein FRB93_003804 [Tulasnella sp. JGI-2019a]KAG9005160.1 hypothetical protein FRB94_001777 [Tulasnella sp. JGI-2019a]
MSVADASPGSSRRPIDIFYAIYFVILIPITLLIDLQSFYPPAVVPQYLKDLTAFYIGRSGDPLMARTLGGPAQMAWFDTFAYLEAGFQLPIFFLTIYGLVQGNAGVYVLTLIYGVHTATTILPCIATFMAIPTAVAGILATPDSSILNPPLAFVADQKQFLIANYVPFLLITIGMAVDSALQLWRMVREAEGQVINRKLAKSIMTGKKTE